MVVIFFLNRNRIKIDVEFFFDNEELSLNIPILDTKGRIESSWRRK